MSLQRIFMTVRTILLTLIDAHHTTSRQTQTPLHTYNVTSRPIHAMPCQMHASMHLQMRHHTDTYHTTVTICPITPNTSRQTSTVTTHHATNNPRTPQTYTTLITPITSYHLTSHHVHTTYHTHHSPSHNIPTTDHITSHQSIRFNPLQSTSIQSTLQTTSIHITSLHTTPHHMT